MTDRTTVEVQLPTELTIKVDSLAETLDKPRDWIVEKAVEEYVETQAWQARAIRAALAQAEAGDFATDDEVNDAFAKLLNAR